jgi:uncharacterized protein (TIGR00730 family)
MTQVTSICVYCGASSQADPAYLELARQTGLALAARGIRLVYGGGNVGLMGAAARACHEAGGQVLGIMPHFLTRWELPNPVIETRMVDTMHERKWGLFSEADAFIALPGGIGTLEEVVETLSWYRLELHTKPMSLLGSRFWAPFDGFVQATIDQKLTPAGFRQAYAIHDTVDEALGFLAEQVQVRAH